MTKEKLVLGQLMADRMRTCMDVEVEQHMRDGTEKELVVTAHARTESYHQTPQTRYHSQRPRKTGEGWRTG